MLVYFIEGTGQEYIKKVMGPDCEGEALILTKNFSIFFSLFNVFNVMLGSVA